MNLSNADRTAGEYQYRSFPKLYIMNIAGLRIPPGLADKATIGSGFNVVLPENEDITNEIGWESFTVPRFFPL